MEKGIYREVQSGRVFAGDVHSRVCASGQGRNTYANVSAGHLAGLVWNWENAGQTGSSAVFTETS